MGKLAAKVISGLASAVLNIRLHYHKDTYLSTWVVNSYGTRVLSAYHSTTRTLLTGRMGCQTFLSAYWLVNNDVMWPREVPDFPYLASNNLSSLKKMKDKPYLLILQYTLRYKQFTHYTLTLIPKIVRRPNIIRFIQTPKSQG